MHQLQTKIMEFSFYCSWQNIKDDKDCSFKSLPSISWWELAEPFFFSSLEPPKQLQPIIVYNMSLLFSWLYNYTFQHTKRNETQKECIQYNHFKQSIQLIFLEVNMKFPFLNQKKKKSKKIWGLRNRLNPWKFNSWP